MALTTYERAQLRLRAWRALKGWGRRGKDGVFAEFDMTERMAEAERLVGWATMDRSITETTNVVPLRKD